VSKDPRASGSSRAAAARASLQGGSFVFPVRSEGKTIGVLSFSSADVREPDPRLLQAVQVIGSQVGQFLQRKHSAEAHLRHHDKIARFGQAALGKREPPELIADAVQSVLEGLGADAVAYVEPGPAERQVVVRALVGVAGSSSAQAEASFAPQAPLGQVLERGELVLLEAATEPPLPFSWARELRSALLVPVRGDRGSRGALCALSKGSRAFGPEETRFLEAAASVLSAGLQRIDSETRLAYLAQFDALTGLPNRALLSDRFSQMIVQARRHAKPLGVLFIDLDDFKLVNDSLGHAGGDALLKEA